MDKLCHIYDRPDGQTSIILIINSSRLRSCIELKFFKLWKIVSVECEEAKRMERRMLLSS